MVLLCKQVLMHEIRFWFFCIFVLNLYLSGADPERICEFSKFQYEKMSATMVGRRKSFLILDGLKLP